MAARSTFTSEEDYFAAFDAYSDVIFRHCYLRTQNREKAKDLTMEAFVRLWTFITEGNYVDAPKLFLFRACHELIEADRPRGVATIPSADAELRDVDLAVLQSIPSDDRAAVLLHFIDGFSVEHITHILGGSPDRHSRSILQGTSLVSA